MTDRRLLPLLGLTVTLAAPVRADDLPNRYSDRKPAWYDPFGLFVPSPKPTAEKNAPPLMVGGPADAPAWKWYGYGTPTPGRNALAPNGSYPPVPVNWHEVAGTTPGAVPLARLGPAVPMPLPEIAPIDPKPVPVVPTASPKPTPNKPSPFGPVLVGPAIDPGWKTAPATIRPAESPARLQVPASQVAPPTQPISIPAAKPPAAPPPGAALPNAGSESPDIPVEAAPGIVVPPLTARGVAPEPTPLDELAAVAKRAEGRDVRILAVDVVGPKSAVVRLTATTVEAARQVRKHFADAPALRGWRIEFELVTVLPR